MSQALPLCPGCGAAVPGHKAFCEPACRTAFHNRMSKRGRVAMPLALAWRGKRGSGDTAKAAFRELCELLDHYNAEDRKAGRPSMVHHVMRRGAWNGGSGWRERAQAISIPERRWMKPKSIVSDDPMVTGPPVPISSELSIMRDRSARYRARKGS